MQNNIRKTRIIKEQQLLQNAQWITKNTSDIIKFEMMEGFGYIYLSPIYPFTQPKFRFEPNRQYFYFTKNYHDYQDYDHFIEQKWTPQLNASNLVDNFKAHIQKHILEKKKNSLDILSDFSDKIYKYGGQNLFYILLMFIVIFMHSIYSIHDRKIRSNTLQIFQTSLVDKVNDICDMYGQPYIGILQKGLQFLANTLIVSKYFNKYYDSIQSGVLLYVVLNNSHQFRLNQFLTILFISIENIYIKTIIISILICLFDLGDYQILMSFYCIYVLASLAFRNHSSFRANYYKLISKLGDVILQGTVQIFIGISIAFFIKFLNAYLEDPNGQFDTLERSFEQWFDLDLFWDHNLFTLLQLIPCVLLIIIKPQLFPIGFGCLASTQGDHLDILPLVILSNKHTILNLESIAIIFNNNETIYFNFFIGFLYSRSIKLSGWMKTKVHYSLLQKYLQIISIFTLFARIIQMEFVVYYSQILIFGCYLIIYNIEIYQKIVKYSRKQKQD